MPYSPALWVAASPLWILDAANNVTMEPYRAYVSDRLDDGADIVTIAHGALANPDLPKRLLEKGVLNDFDPAILGPIANIKESELAM